MILVNDLLFKDHEPEYFRIFLLVPDPKNSYYGIGKEKKFATGSFVMVATGGISATGDATSTPSMA